MDLKAIAEDAIRAAKEAEDFPLFRPLQEAEAEDALPEESVESAEPVMDAPLNPNPKPMKPAPGANAAPGGTPPRPKTAPGGKPPKSAEQMGFDLAKHDAHFHPNGYKEGDRCKYREKMAAQAKAMGLGPIKGLENFQVSEETVQKERGSEAWKAYQAQRASAAFDFQRKLMEKGLRQDLSSESENITDEERKMLDEHHAKMDAIRDDFIRKSLGEAEADCVQKLADALASGGPKADEIADKISGILDTLPENDPNKVAAEKILEKKNAAEAASQNPAETSEPKPAPEPEPEAKPEGEPKPAEGGESPSPEGGDGNFGEQEVGGKTYVDVSGKGLLSGMIAAFRAGMMGKGVVTDWDKMTGRWDAIKMEAKQKEDADKLKQGLAEGLQSALPNGKKDTTVTEDMIVQDTRNALGYMADGEEKLRAQKKVEGLLSAYENAKDETKKMAAWDDLMAFRDKMGWRYYHETPIPYAEQKTTAGAVQDSELGNATSKSGASAKADAIKGQLENDCASLGINRRMGEDGQPEGIGLRADTYTTSIKIPIDKSNPPSDAMVKKIAQRIQYRYGLEDGEVSVEANSKDGTLDVKMANDKIGIVPFAEMYKTKEWKDAVAKAATEGGLPCIIGRDENGKPVIGDLAQMKHLLLTGKTGYGKTSNVRSILGSILASYGPDRVRLTVIDPKNKDGLAFAGFPHLTGDIITDAKEAGGRLEEVCGEMASRAKELNGMDFVAYNKAHPEKPIPYHIVYIDELKDLLDQNRKGVEMNLGRLLQKARALGIHVVAATQNVTTDVLPSTLRGNFPARLSSKVENSTAAKVAGNPGAEKLPGVGAFIYNGPAANGKDTTIKGQGAFVEDTGLTRMVEHYGGEPHGPLAAQLARERAESGEQPPSRPAAAPAPETAPEPSPASAGGEGGGTAAPAESPAQPAAPSPSAQTEWPKYSEAEQGVLQHSPSLAKSVSDGIANENTANALAIGLTRDSTGLKDADDLDALQETAVRMMGQEGDYDIVQKAIQGIAHISKTKQLDVKDPENREKIVMGALDWAQKKIAKQRSESPAAPTQSAPASQPSPAAGQQTETKPSGSPAAPTASAGAASTAGTAGTPAPAPATATAETPAPTAQTATPTPAPSPAPTAAPKPGAAASSPTASASNQAQKPAAPQVPKGIQHMVDSSLKAYQYAEAAYNKSHSIEDLDKMTAAQNAYVEAKQAATRHANASTNLDNARKEYAAASKARMDAVNAGQDTSAAEARLRKADRALRAARAENDSVEAMNRRGEMELNAGKSWMSGAGDANAPKELPAGMMMTIKGQNGQVSRKIRKTDKGQMEVFSHGKWTKLKGDNPAANYFTSKFKDGDSAYKVTYNGNGEFTVEPNSAALNKATDSAEDLFGTQEAAMDAAMFSDELMLGDPDGD